MPSKVVLSVVAAAPLVVAGDSSVMDVNEDFAPVVHDGVVLDAFGGDTTEDIIPVMEMDEDLPRPDHIDDMQDLVEEANCEESAGFSWCESKKKCLQEWIESCPAEKEDEDVKELEEEDDGTTEEEKCDESAGFTWCEPKSKCLREWEEECESKMADEEMRPIGGKLPGEKCLSAAGFGWCESKSKCLQEWLEECPGGTDADKEEKKEMQEDIDNCAKSAPGMAWCELFGECIHETEACKDPDAPVEGGATVRDEDVQLGEPVMGEVEETKEEDEEKDTPTEKTEGN